MRAGIVVLVTRADRHRLEAIARIAARRRTRVAGQHDSCHCRTLRHGRDHAPLGPIKAHGVEMAGAFYDRGRRRADARQDA
jgi:hypothetical protein